MSIFKESFPSHIKNQLLKRGEALNRRNLTDIAIHNGAKSWLRMSSSVDVKEDGGALAKNYILTGGALYNDKLRSGVGKGPENAYSLQTPSGKTHLYGIRPMPGITSAEVKSKGAYGSLREVTINFNCWDITQLEDLELLYMRPGYSVLLEWGWTAYINNDGDLVTTPEAPFNIFDSNNNGKDYQNVFQQLFEKEERAQGNYGGFLGIVKNYKWSARPDGGYDCSTTLISIGEMIESLKINYSAANLSLISLETNGYLKITKSAKTPDPVYLKEFYSRNFISGLIYELWCSVESENQSAKYEVTDKYGVKYDMFTMDIELHGEGEEDEDFDETDRQKFITLESLCKLINNHVTVGIVAEDGNKPIVGVTTSDRPYQNGVKMSSENLKKPEAPYLLGLCHPLQISVNPTVCLIKNDIWGAFKLPDDLGSTPTGSEATTTVAGDPGPQVKDSAGNSINIDFDGNLTSVEAAAKTTIDLVIPQVLTDYGDNEEKAAAALSKYLDACKAKGITEDAAARELQRQYELTVDVNRKVDQNGVEQPDVTVGGNVSYKNEQFYDFLDELFFESEIEDISLGLKNLKGTDLGIIKTRKASITAQIELERKTKEVKDAQEGAAKALAFLDNLKPFSVADESGTPDAACKAGLGQIGNIYVSLRYLLKISKDPGLEGGDKTEKNTINLYDFLKKMLADISTATGNVNNFDIHVDPLDSIARIIDINFVDTQSKAEAYKNTFTFYSEDGTPTGKYNGLWSTVRNYSLESQIFSEQSSIVAIGAQTGGGQLGLENDTMVGFNQGVKDRLKKKINAMNTTSADDSTAIQLENLLTNLLPIYEFISWMGRSWIGDFEADFEVTEASKYEGALRDVIAIFRSLSKNPIKFKAIIPTKLSLEIDGISNLIIGHMFNIHPDLLPKGYKTEGDSEAGRRLGYILTGIGHTINDSGWTTKLEGQTIILEEPDGAETDLFDVTLTSTGGVKEAKPNIKTGAGGSLSGSGGGKRPYPGEYPDYTDKNGKLKKGYSGAVQVLAPESVNTSNFSKYYPKYKLIKGTSDINLSKPNPLTKKAIPLLTEAGIIDDTTKNRFNLGTIATTPTVFVVHHTAGRGSADLVYSVFYGRGLPAQYVIDREGGIHRFQPDGAKGAHAGNYNSISIGVEVVAKNDADVLPDQVIAAARLIQFLGFKKSQIFGHGELSTDKAADEGKTIKDFITTYL
jgi:hypothetical protein